MFTPLFIVSPIEADRNMKFVKYEEVADCKEKSERIEVIDTDTGVVGYVVKSECTEKENHENRN